MQEVRAYKPATVSRRLSAVAGFYRICVIDGVLEHSPADYVPGPRSDRVADPRAESPAVRSVLTAARRSTNPNDFALVAMLGLLGLRIFEATSANIETLSEAHGHRVLNVRGKGDKPALVPLPPAVGRAFDRAIAERDQGPILRSSPAARMDRHCATRRLRALADEPRDLDARMHPHMLPTPMSPRCSTPASTSETSRSPLATPIRGPRCAMTELARTSTATPTTSSRPTWPPGHDIRIDAGRLGFRPAPSPSFTCSAFPPIDLGLIPQQHSGEQHIRCIAEPPQFFCRPAVLKHDVVELEDIDITRTKSIDRFPDMMNKLRQTRLVIGRDRLPRCLPLRLARHAPERYSCCYASTQGGIRAISPHARLVRVP